MSKPLTRRQGDVKAKGGIALTVILLALAACSSDDSSAAPTTASSSRAAPHTSGSSPTATGGMSIEDGAAQYKQLVDPVNCANADLQRVNAAITNPDGSIDSSKWQQIQPPLQALADASRDFAIAVRNAEWPSAISAADIDKLSTTATAYSLVLGQAAAAEDPSEFGSIVTGDDFRSTLDAAAVAADVVRQQLGLPSALETEAQCTSR